MTIKYIDETYLEQSVSLMAKYNKEKSYKVGYCCVQPDSIRRDLISSLADEENKLIGVLEEDELMGVVDLDIDLEKKTIEMVGPFIDHKEEEVWLEIAMQLMHFIFENLGHSYKYRFFIHQENQIGKKLLEMLGAKFNEHEYALSLKRDDVKIQTAYKEVVTVQAIQYEEIIEMHDSIWPGVYYSGKDIIGQLDENHQLFIAKHAEEVEGYIFVENELEAGRGYIHFLAVKEPYRRGGIGRSLLNKALEWSLSNNQITQISLCVEVENEKALNLYYNVGFKLENAYTAYIIESKE